MDNALVVIMAAGKGTRMKSERPKVLHRVCGASLLEHTLRATDDVPAARRFVIVGHGADAVRTHVGERATCLLQDPPRGTGDAVMKVQPHLGDFKGDVVVLSADVPLVTREVVEALRNTHREAGAAVTLLSARVPGSPTLGRVVRDRDGAVTRIVEAREATPEQLANDEINAGAYVFDADFLREMMPKMGRPNVQDEIYLTDLIVLAAENRRPMTAVCWPDAMVAQGINTRVELAQVEAELRRRILERLMLEGVTVIDPATTYVDVGVTVGRDTTLWPGTMLQGRTRVGDNCEIGPQTRIKDSDIGSAVSIQYSIVTESDVGDEVTVGPYAYIRPGTRVGRKARIGDFVELKKAIIGVGSKVPHLAYVGDATLGDGVNIGAGTITCNYDGKKKHPTVLEDGVFIGANTNLVAPVKVGRNSKTGAGSVVTRDVPPDTLVAGVPARPIRSLSTKETTP